MNGWKDVGSHRLAEDPDIGPIISALQRLADTRALAAADRARLERAAAALTDLSELIEGATYMIEGRRLVERVRERPVVDQAAAGGVDQQGPPLHEPELGPVDHVAGRRHERRVQGDDVADPQDLLERRVRTSHRRSKATKVFLDRLADLFEAATGCRPTYRWDPVAEAATSPFAQFALTVLGIVDPETAERQRGAESDIQAAVGRKRGRRRIDDERTVIRIYEDPRDRKRSRGRIRPR